MAKLIEKVNLSPNCDKDVYHIALETDIKYNIGDVIKIYPENHISLLEGYEDLKDYDLRVPSINLIKHISDRDIELQDIIKPYNISKQKQFIYKYTVKELLDKYGSVPISELKQLLNPIRGRAYSISSSNKVFTNQVHLLVSIDKFVTHRGEEKGTASRYIESLNIGDEVKIEHKSKNFYPPNNKDIIMIGPGTGIAPFIGFLQEDRDGNNWLFFGERNRKNNFYYKDFILDKEKLGLNLSLAFSRDQENKIYVQDKIEEHKDKFKEWILGGAYIFICGDINMSIDVEQKILSILNDDLEEAKKMLKNMKKEKKYLLDVY